MVGLEGGGAVGEQGDDKVGQEGGDVVGEESCSELLLSLPHGGHDGGPPPSAPDGSLKRRDSEQRLPARQRRAEAPRCRCGPGWPPPSADSELGVDVALWGKDGRRGGEEGSGVVGEEGGAVRGRGRFRSGWGLGESA